MRWLIDRMMFDFSSVPLRVSLAAIAHLRSYSNVVKEVSSRGDDVRQIADLISISALEGLDQFYEAFVAFTSKFGYEHRETVVALAESIPELLSVPPESIGERQWASACEALSNAAISARGANKPSLAERLLASMEIFAQAIVASGIDNPYTVRVVVKAFVTAGLPAVALQICEKAAPTTKDHWILYRKSQALLDINQVKDALDVGREALGEALKDSKAKDHIPSYHEQLSKCAEVHGDLPLAVACCEDAIKAGPNDKYLLHLKERLSRLQSPPKAAAEVSAPNGI
jgi:tetratricopeptide (TPR) repeat protein